VLDEKTNYFTDCNGGVKMNYYDEQWVDDLEKSDMREKLTDIFNLISDDSLLDIAVAAGEATNQVTKHFPCYDVALKIKSHGWTPTVKQRSAITNVLAWYLSELY
jgi:hypothetical protein